MSKNDLIDVYELSYLKDLWIVASLETWNIGMLEYWVFGKGTIIPSFHYSIIPASFWQNVNAGIIIACHAKSILDTNERFYRLVV